MYRETGCHGELSQLSVSCAVCKVIYSRCDKCGVVAVRTESITSSLVSVPAATDDEISGRTLLAAIERAKTC